MLLPIEPHNCFTPIFQTISAVTLSLHLKNKNMGYRKFCFPLVSYESSITLVEFKFLCEIAMKSEGSINFLIMENIFESHKAGIMGMHVILKQNIAFSVLLFS